MRSFLHPVRGEQKPAAFSSFGGEGKSPVSESGGGRGSDHTVVGHGVAVCIN